MNGDFLIECWMLQMFLRRRNRLPTTPFLNMFGRSPIRPLEEHMGEVNQCVKLLIPFFESVLAKDWDQAEKWQQEIVKLENKADQIKRDLRLHLPKSLFMAFSRNDLLELLNMQDRLANKAKDIAGMVLGRQMILPENISSLLMTFLQKNIEASHQANAAIHELDELLETGLSGNEIKLVESMVDTLAQIERTTDAQQIELRRHLFAIEKTLSPIEVMFLYNIIEWIGDIADVAREVGDDLLILLAR